MTHRFKYSQVCSKWTHMQHTHLHRGLLVLGITSEHTLTWHILGVWAGKHQRRLCSSSDRLSGGRTQNTAVERREKKRRGITEDKIWNLSLINTLVRVHKQAFHGSNLPDYISGCSSLCNEPHKAQPKAWGRQSDYPKSMAVIYSITSTSNVGNEVWQTAQEFRSPLWPYPLCPLLLVNLLCQKSLQLLLNWHQLLWIHSENVLKQMINTTDLVYTWYYHLRSRQV